MKFSFSKITDWALGAWNYFNVGVWEDARRNWRVGLVKTLSLSMRSFLDTQLWVKAAALTYSTVLAIVPALALVFAIGRGFGFQNLLEDQLMHYFPAQSEALATGLNFVDSYLNQASEGVFVGVGIIFLLYTLLSLMSSVEDAFNEAWGVRHGRSWWRKITDYTAIFLVLPILMICSSGIQIVMTTTLRHLLPWEFLQSAVSWLLDMASVALIWLFFTGTYMLFPNTRVKFKYALVSGVIAGSAFMILEWLFVSGQLYVARYNAIYGSFSFLPLLLLWLQLVWLITLSGAVVCYALQNIYNISYINKVSNISIDYKRRVSLAVMSVIAASFKNREPAPTVSSIAHDYNLPANLVSQIVNRLQESGLVSRVVLPDSPTETGLAPAIPVADITLGAVLSRLGNTGDSGFIPGFDTRFAALLAAYASGNKDAQLADIAGEAVQERDAKDGANS